MKWTKQKDLRLTMDEVTKLKKIIEKQKEQIFPLKSVIRRFAE